MQVFDLESITEQRSRTHIATDEIRKSKAWLYLSDTDRTILEMVEKGMPHRLIAQAVGMNAGTVSRRLTIVRSRLRSPLARCALDAVCPLPSKMRMIVLMHIVGGQCVTHIARQQHLTTAAVNEQLTFARGIARGIGSRSLV